MAFTSDGKKLVVLFGNHHRRPGRRHSETDRATDRSGRVQAGIHPFVLSALALRAHARRPHARHRVDEGELAWWDLRTGRKTRTREITTGYHAVAISPDGRTAAVGVEEGIQLIDMRSGAERTRERGLRRQPQLAVVRPGRQDGRVGEPRRDPDASGTSPRRPRETLRGHSTACGRRSSAPTGRRSTRSGDDGTAIAWDLAGHRRVKRAFRSRTTVTSTRRTTATREVQPGRCAVRGRPQGAGRRASGREPADPGRAHR